MPLDTVVDDHAHEVDDIARHMENLLDRDLIVGMDSHLVVHV